MPFARTRRMHGSRIVKLENGTRIYVGGLQGTNRDSNFVVYEARCITLCLYSPCLSA